MKIKKGDKVIVITGKDRNKTGVIEKVIPKTGRILVSGLNVYKKHLKPSRKYPHGGIVDINKSIIMSNLALICPRCEKKTKIAMKQTQDKKLRICKKCAENVDVKN